MASKIQVAKFHDFSEGPMLDPTSSGVWNMEENDVVGQLRDESFKKRVEILEQLIITVKRNGGRLPYSDHESIFRGLGLALSDSNWEIRLKCIVLLQELIPSLQDDLDHCMSLVLNKLISNIGDSKVTLRKAVISNLHRYMKHTKNLPALLHAIVNTGLENEDARVRRETICALPMLLTRDFTDANLYGIVQSLAKKLLDTSTEDNLKDVSLTTLESIEKLLGEDKFEVYIQKLSPSLRKYFLQLTGKLENATENQDHSGMYSARQTSTQSGLERQDRYMDNLEFGIVPTHIMTRINDQKDFKTRAQAVEDLKGVVLSLTPSDINQKLIPNMLPFMSFLNSLLDDSNFKIITVTLEIVYSVVERLGASVKNYVKNIVNVLSKRMGDNKVVIRQSIMRVLMKMMQCYSPQLVLSVIFDNLSHRNSRVRQEIINFIIAALLTFPSYEFDLPSICMVVGPTLTDVKRQVRQAALECFAVLAQAMGSGRLQPLVQAVDQVELSSEGEGLMAAVQARLARRQLPRLNGDGLVEYATPVPSSATQRSSPASQSADTEWILAVGGGTVRTARSDIMELESVTSGSARSTPMTDSCAPTPVPRRFMSAGRGRNKLPWEEDERSRAYEDLPNSAPAHERKVKSAKVGSLCITEEVTPPKPRPMWMEEGGTPDYRKGPKRRTTLDSLGIQNDDNESTGSYSKMYQQRRQMVNGSRTNSFNGSVDMPDFARDIKSEQRTPRTVLDPISADYYSKSSTDANRADEDESPIPLKPALARGATTHRGSTRVPPISSSSTAANGHDDDTDSAYSVSTSSTPSRTGSLRGTGIRNSAKNKAQRLFDRIEKQESRQSLASSPTESDRVEESGIFSTSSTITSVKSKRTDNTAADPKPKASTYAAMSRKRSNDNLDVNENRHTVHLDYNPNSGVTFRENPNSDVQVVGRGYNEDSSSTYDTRSTQPVNTRARDRRRTTKGSLLSPMGAPALSSTLPSTSTSLSPDFDRVGEEEKEKPSPQDRMALVGRGMFESSASISEYPVSSSGMAEKAERRRLEASKGAAPAGVVGVAVRSTADMSNFETESTTTMEDDSEDDHPSLAKSMQRSIAHKQRLKKEQEERAKQERERENEQRQRENEQRQREKEDKLRQEKERQQQKLKKLGSNDSLFVESLSISGSGSSSLSSTMNSTISSTRSTPPRPVPPVVTPRKTIKTSSEPVSIHPMPAVDRAPDASEAPPEEWKPFSDPDASLKAAQKKLENDDWEMKTEGLHMIRRIVHFHPETFSPVVLHPVILAIVNEVKNLRSQVSRLAIVCLGNMFAVLKKAMDPDLDIVTKQLLAKAGESNNFIRDDVDQSLSSMVAGVTPQRSLLALIAGGATHKNPAVRRTTAQFLVEVVERMGSGKILSGVKDVTDRVLPTAAQFVMDGSPETRYHGRKILWLLMSHQDFDRMLTKYLPANTLRNIQDVVENLKNKGLGEKPSETASARARRSGQVSRMGTTLRGGSASSNADSFNNGTPPVRRRAVRTDEATMDEIKTMTNQLSAREWRDRYDAVNTFLEMCVERPDTVSLHIIKIFDKFLPRLQDSNSKVNLHALKVMQQVVPMIKEALPSVISMAVASVVPNLSSKNREINLTATDILHSYMEHLDQSLLIQPFANQAQCATGQSKAEMVVKVAYLADRVYDRKPKQIVLHVLPLLWHLLAVPGVAGGSGSGELRSATANLAASLWDHMGQGLIDKANSDPNMSSRHVGVLQEILNL